MHDNFRFFDWCAGGATILNEIHQSDAQSGTAQFEISRGDRFGFGGNWQRFLSQLDDDRIEAAKESLIEAFGSNSLSNESFLDIGCGSGLFSLAAHLLGARVYSFDYDTNSVTCTNQLRERYLSGSQDWTVAQGSVLDAEHIDGLGKFSIVYSWGVLHHTGSMWKALQLAGNAVAADGRLFISIYNDQGAKSRRWLRIKKFYNSGVIGRTAVIGLGVPYFVLRRLKGSIVAALRGQNFRKRRRGMAFLSDAIDWLGGYPFEVASPEEIFEFYRKQGFELIGLTTTNGGKGCNEFMFQRSRLPDSN